MRTCTRCKLEKPDTEFFPSLKYYCKACHKRYMDAQKERDPYYLKRWREANPDAYKRWYAANRQHKSESYARWRADNRERIRERLAEWSRNNLPRVVAKNTERRANKLKATPPWADREAIRAVYRQAAELTKTTGVRHEVDHIVPLQGKIVSGLHWEGNLQILPKAENISKHNRVWPDMP